MDVFTQIVNNFGVPTAVMVFAAFCLWRLGNWLLTNAVEPLVKSIVSLVQTLQAKVPEQCAKLDRLIEATDNQSAILERVAKAVENGVAPKSQTGIKT
jgi:hypothetical protein